MLSVMHEVILPANLGLKDVDLSRAFLSAKQEVHHCNEGRAESIGNDRTAWGRRCSQFQCRPVISINTRVLLQSARSKPDRTSFCDSVWHCHIERRNTIARANIAYPLMVFLYQAMPMCKEHGELQTLAHLSLASDSDGSIERTACTFTRKSFLIHGTIGQSGIQKIRTKYFRTLNPVHHHYSPSPKCPLIAGSEYVPCSSLSREKKNTFLLYSRMLNKKAPHLLIPT